jgi:hypothetical protein
MAGWDFPTALEIGGISYDIRCDFRAILDIMDVLADPDVSDEERAIVALSIFYIGFDPMSAAREENEEAINGMKWFISGGRESERDKEPRVMDWDQDFHLIVAPINHVLGYECRSVKHLHWWTFLAAYMEIGECYFQQVVSIRMKKAQGKRLDKADEEFYRKHKADVDLKREMTDEEESILKEWLM